jgi:hypothetical protein
VEYAKFGFYFDRERGFYAGRGVPRDEDFAVVYGSVDVFGGFYFLGKLFCQLFALLY